MKIVRGMAFLIGAAAVISGGAHGQQVNVLDQICGPELESRVARAKDLIRKNGFDKAYALLEPCSLRLKSGTEAKKVLDQARDELAKTPETGPKELLQKIAAEDKRQRAQWRKEGVSIGMSAERVLLSSWGKPERVNRTTNEFGVREQWVYGGGNYLYFKDGILTSIQN